MIAYHSLAGSRNPFKFGDLALDETFTDREDELRELKSDILNGQNVVIFAPRRYGKSSLIWRATQELAHEDVLLAQIDLMKTATKEQLAAKLAQAVYEQIATPLFRARARGTQIFRSLRIVPVITVDPNDGSLGFTFSAGRAREDVDATLEKLLQLPAELSAERGRRTGLVFDEFQEILDLSKERKQLPRFPLNISLRARAKTSTHPVESANVVGKLKDSVDQFARRSSKCVLINVCRRGKRHSRRLSPSFSAPRRPSGVCDDCR